MTTPLELQVARVLLMKGRPYLATAVWALQPVPVRDHPMLKGTLGVDKHWRLYFDPDILPAWSPEALATALNHELNHLLRSHHQRADALGLEFGDDEAENIVIASKLQIANIAQDCSINAGLEEERLKFPPINYATPAKYGLKPNDPWENYYHELLKNAKPVKLMCIGGAGGCGSCADGKTRPYELPRGEKDAPGISQAEAELVIRKTAADVQEHARTRGTVPASLKRWADDLLNPQVPWQRVLASAIRRSLSVAMGATYYSFQRPNRRNGGELILPGMVQPVPNVAVIGDTSGSMGDNELRKIVLTELKGICQALGRGSLTFLDVDAEVHSVQRVQSERQVKLRGGGGTDMRVGIERACQVRPKPSLIIVLTDGATPWPASPPEVRCLAVVPKGASATPDWMARVEVEL